MSSSSSLFSGSWGEVLFLNAVNFPFILVFPSHSSSTCPLLLVWGGYSSCQSSHQSGWEKLGSMVWVWVCQAMGSTLRRWQPSPLHCSCIGFVLFFRLLVGCWVQSRPRPSPWIFKELPLRVLSSKAPRPGYWALNSVGRDLRFGPHNIYLYISFFSI